MLNDADSTNGVPFCFLKVSVTKNCSRYQNPLKLSNVDVVRQFQGKERKIEVLYFQNNKSGQPKIVGGT